MPQALSEETSNDMEVTDQIADLLIEDESPNDSNDEETQTGESNEGQEESNEESNSDEQEHEQEAEGSEEDAEQQEEDDEQSWESVLGVDESKLSFDDKGNVAGINVKIDGEISKVPMADLIAGYQTNKSVTQRSQTLAEERKTFDSQRVQVEQMYKEKLGEVDALSKHFEKQLLSEYDNIDWDKMRAEDPAEYAAARQDFAYKAQEMQRIQDAIKLDKDKASQESSNTNAQSQQAYLSDQFDKMLINNPTWTDETVRKTDMESHKKFMTDTYGFTDNDLNSIMDSRVIEVLKDAKKFHEGAKVSAAKIRKPVPKFQKSKGKASKKVSKLDKLTAASRKASGANKRDLQKSAVAELLLGG